jgi:signal transduction histidine kinase
VKTPLFMQPLGPLSSPVSGVEEPMRLLARRLRVAILAILVGSVPFALLDVRLPEEAQSLAALVRLVHTGALVALLFAVARSGARAPVTLAHLVLAVFISGSAALGVIGGDSLSVVMLAQLSLLTTAAFFPWGAAAQSAATLIAVTAVSWAMLAVEPGLDWLTSFPVLMLGFGAAFSIYVSWENERQRRARDATEEMHRDLVAMLSHDIKNPLATVLGFVDLLRDMLPDSSAEVSDALDRIGGGARRALLLADNFVHAARIDSGATDLRTETADLGEIADEAIRSVEGWARTRQIRLVHRRAEPLPVRPLDRNRMERAIANLLSNAIKYSPSKGEIEVETAVDGESLVVRVRDQGPGIRPEDRGRLFQKFRRGADGRMSGTGLGLFVVRSVAETHGGTVSVECPAVGGSTFEIRLPIAPAVESGERTRP